MERYKATPEFLTVITRHGVTVTELAEAAGMDRSAVSQMANGSYAWNVRAVNAWKIARAFARLGGLAEEEAFKLLFQSVGDSQKNLAPAQMAA